MPDDARRLFDAACDDIGFGATIATPLAPARAPAAALVLSREWAIPDLEQRVMEAIEASYEPTWDRARGEFTWGMGLEESHPRGQFNAFLAAAEASSRGSWSRLSASPLPPCAQAVGVDFPAVALSRAEWSGDTLHITIVPLVEQPDQQTEFSVVGLEPGRGWKVVGAAGAHVSATAHGVKIVADLVASSFSVSAR